MKSTYKTILSTAIALLLVLTAGISYSIVAWDKLVLVDSTTTDPPLYRLNCEEGGNKCTVDLSDTIKDSEGYGEIYDLLQSAKEGDVIFFHLTGYGGNAFTMSKLISEINLTEAKVVMVVTGEVYSAHAILALAGDDLIIGPQGMLMYHDIQMNGQGTPYDSTDPRTQETIASFHRLLKVLFEDLLTKEEQAKIFAGGEVYISGPVMQERWDQSRTVKAVESIVEDLTEVMIPFIVLKPVAQ